MERYVDQVTVILLFLLPVLTLHIKAEKVTIRHKESQEAKDLLEAENTCLLGELRELQSRVEKVNLLST